MDPLQPFLTFFKPSPDMSLSDIEAEIDRLVQRNQAIELMLQGTLEPDTVLDMLAEDDIEPYEWVEASAENCGILFYG